MQKRRRRRSVGKIASRSFVIHSVFSHRSRRRRDPTDRTTVRLLYGGSKSRWFSRTAVERLGPS